MNEQVEWNGSSQVRFESYILEIKLGEENPHVQAIKSHKPIETQA